MILWLIDNNNGWYVKADHRGDQKDDFPIREVHKIGNVNLFKMILCWKLQFSDIGKIAPFQILFVHSKYTLKLSSIFWQMRQRKLLNWKTWAVYSYVLSFYDKSKTTLRYEKKKTIRHRKRERERERESVYVCVRLWV